MVIPASGATFDRSAELSFAKALAKEGGALVLRHREKWNKVSYKAGDEPVTEADEAVSALCIERLRSAFPNDAILSEEAPPPVDEQGRLLLSHRTWLIDPIDGTKDFIASRPGFSVMVGLLYEGRPVLGVVYQPCGDRLFYATAGTGAFCQIGSQEPVRMFVSNVSDLASARMVSSASHKTQMVDDLREAAGIRDNLDIGSVGIKLCLIAAGDRDLYVNPMGRTKLWDSGPPEIILSEAGGRLSDLRGSPLVYAEDLTNRYGLCASNGKIHEAALALLRPFATPPL